MNPLTIKPSEFWLSVAESAQLSGWSSQWVRTLIHSGQLLAMKRYGQWRINTRSLRNYMHKDIRDAGDVITGMSTLRIWPIASH